MTEEPAANEGRLADELVAKILGWKSSADRYVKPNRSWIPKWRFSPLKRIGDAFDLLEATKASYRLDCSPENVLRVEVEVGGQVGQAHGQLAARTITLALARAVGLTEGDALRIADPSSDVASSARVTWR